MCTKGRRILRALFDHWVALPDHLPRAVQARWGGAIPAGKLERAAVVEVAADVEAEARNLISAAVRRELAAGSVGSDPEQIMSDREALVKLEELRKVVREVTRSMPDTAAAWYDYRNAKRRFRFGTAAFYLL